MKKISGALAALLLGAVLGSCTKVPVPMPSPADGTFTASGQALCPPTYKPCGTYVVTQRVMGGDILPASAVFTGDQALLTGLGKTFKMQLPTVAANFMAGQLQLTAEQLDQALAGKILNFSFQMQTTDQQGRAVFTFAGQP
ncbi:hypothetical protein DKM44_03755 [Deinococcus irradiatisoli]|uniref:Lipoprotein n=1 Tax=Deinococcus irradiatisoli TaxID=2202254 RepID=A0A2Z3JGJ0_9DEIO|nr:hypothetical protein [Deinococcus irradiatisoli]AWN22460.1 hypothetical protein DKM44_03755 [Deinococcus irradiatisoli]